MVLVLQLLFSTCKDLRGILSRTAFPYFWDLAVTLIRCTLPYITASFPAKPQGRGKSGICVQVLQKW